ncbi:disease resistance protein RUN1-like [Cryptomeria japonica]|uniref:disease resistance protein RUN1-like n=1 Tax=Cryptomeria japonica TaxID=3369 RepID=UPI0027DA7075|nr:disease resistance protein RUN1-like [Cryptomeria japonica]
MPAYVYNLICEEIQEECPPTSDQIDTTQVMNSSCREYWRSTVEMSNFGTINSSLPNAPIRSERGQKFLDQNVFLSHSGRQKNFVRQLHRDLTNQGVSCFFDQDRESLPVGEDFPSRIFEAAKTCQVAVLLLSMDFLQSRWPMLELSAFVEARDRTRKNPNLKILPLFYQISPDALKNISAEDENWKQLEKSEEKRAEWHESLNAIRRNNGLKISEGDDEVKFRDEIVKEIWRILPTPSPRYNVRCMQGQVRMCQGVADFFNFVHPDKKGIRIAGLYGIPGQGKTILAKAFCNFKLGVFEGKVCHLEFSRGDSFERLKIALQYLTCCPQSYLQALTDQDQAQNELYRRVERKRVLLVLDNITEECIDEVAYYLKADLGENSWILLSARSVDVLERHFKIDKQSCIRVPRLIEEEAIAILLENASVEVSMLGADEKAFAVKCAGRCSFKEVAWTEGTFHPLALKAFGGHLFNNHGLQLSKWVAEIEGWVDRCGYGLDKLLALLGKAFDNMCPEYRTIFMLLTLYLPPDMSPHKVTEWLAMIVNKEISFIEKAVEDLCKKAFIEESRPKIRIHDLYVEFAQSKADEMGRWLWWMGDPRSTRGLISKDNAGFELAKFEQCMHQRLSQIALNNLQNLLVLQLIGVQKMTKLDLDGMGCLRSITLHKCNDLKALECMEKLQQLAWLQISEVNPMFKLPELSSLKGLQHLQINLAGSQVLNQLGDLTSCAFLREINVYCRSLWEFPRLNSLRYLEKVEFIVRDNVNGPVDCTECVELQSTLLKRRSRRNKTTAYLIGRKKLSKTVLWDPDAVKACPDLDAVKACPDIDAQVESFVASKDVSALKSLESCEGLKNLQLWNLRNLEELPSFRLLSNLTVLKIGKCGISEAPDLTCCLLLEDVWFSTLENLQSFPEFSPLRKLKKLGLYNCCRVEDPPDVSGCHELQVFHLVYNDNLKGLPDMGECPRLEEIKLSWYSSEENNVKNSEDSSELKDETFSNLSDVSAPEALKEWKWLEGKTVLGIKYVRGGKMYYCITAPCESVDRMQFVRKVTIDESSLYLPDPSFYVSELITTSFISYQITTTVLTLVDGRKAFTTRCGDSCFAFYRGVHFASGLLLLIMLVFISHSLLSVIRRRFSKDRHLDFPALYVVAERDLRAVTALAFIVGILQLILECNWPKCGVTA